MTNPFINFKTRDWVLWIISLAAVMGTNILGPDFDLLTLIATILGVTSLIFAAKGHVLAPLTMIVFCLLYGVISYRFSYWGEMATYLGMSLPMAIFAAVTWFKNPSETAGEVEIGILGRKRRIIVFTLGLAVTVIFYFILGALDTPNLFISTLSIITSFMGAALTMLRSSYFALWYAGNDLVLITLWVLASITDPVYIPVAVNFFIFFFNDVYGFISWKKREDN